MIGGNMLTKKYYRDIANIINEISQKDCLLLDAEELVNLLSDYFKRDNSAFSKSKFVEACFFTWDSRPKKR